MSTFDYCPKCGSNTIAPNGQKEWVCSNCGFTYFHNTAAAVVAILRFRDELLLAVRKHEPCKGQYDFPGGFVDYHETLEAGLTREIREELQIDIEDWTYVFSGPNQYRYKGTTYHTADSFFVHEFDERPAIVAGDDVAEAVWIPIDKIDLNDVGFPSIREAIRRMRTQF